MDLLLLGLELIGLEGKVDAAINGGKVCHVNGEVLDNVILGN